MQNGMQNKTLKCKYIHIEYICADMFDIILKELFEYFYINKKKDFREIISCIFKKFEE